MPLSHYNNVNTAKGNNEVVHKNLYEVTVVLPPIVAAIHKNADPKVDTMLLENITTIKFPTYPTLEVATQRFKYSTRKFVMMPGDTSQAFSMTLNLNQNVAYQVYCWRVLKDWYDLAWNNEDGSLHYKRNIIGDVIIHNHDKEGHVIRRVVYKNVQPTELTGWEELDWSQNTEPFSLTASYIADYWIDYYY